MRVVIAGAGEVGRFIAAMLAGGGADVVLIDRDRVALAVAGSELDVQTLEGDATHRRVLREAGVADCDGFIAVSGSDTANLLSAALARTLGAAAVVARADAPDFYDGSAPVEHHVLGVGHVLCATRLAAATLLCQLDRVEDPFADGFADQRVRVGLWEVSDEADVVGRSGASVALPVGAWVSGVVRDGLVRSPEEVVRLESGDRLLVAGARSALASGRPRVARPLTCTRVLVTGGGRTGAQVARELAGREVRVEVVEIDEERCQRLAAELPGVGVLAGDATRAGFLTDIQVESVDAVLATTGTDEINLVTTLLVRQLSARLATSAHTFMVAHRPGYVELCKNLGIEGVVSEFEVLARAVLEATTPAGRLVGQTPLPRTGYAVAEIRLPGHASSRASGFTVGDLPLPAGAICLAVVTDSGSRAPHRDVHISGGDVLVMAFPVREARRLERQLRPLVGEI